MRAVYSFIRETIIRYRRFTVTVFHLLLAALSNYAAFVLRFEGFISPYDHQTYYLLFEKYIPLLILIRLILYYWEGMHKDLWQYSSISDLIKILRTVTLGSVIFFITVRYGFADDHYPRSIYILDWLLLIGLSGGSRLGFRIFREYVQQAVGRKVLIIGAGSAGELIVRDMRSSSRYGMQPIGFIDDDPHKKNMTIHGLPIFGPLSSLGRVIEKHEPAELIIAMPTVQTKVVREVFEYCKEFNLPVKTLPGLHDIVDGKVSVSQIRPLSLEDLLQRDQIRSDIKEVSDLLSNRTVLVTGAGGSIGSELCRQIFEYRPAKLILFDRYENGLFQIDFELCTRSKKRPSDSATVITTVVGDMQDRMTVEQLFAEHRPQHVFHAAAHKHVPLMELNPLEAVRNNIFGTRNLIEAAERHQCEHFVMISTDKAVNPTNVMGATKRIAEFMSLCKNKGSLTKFTTVRFGNVLGSNGSVVHIFKEQIHGGGPITVTHPDIKRFFMLIPEAVQLVLISSARGKGGDIFVLEMGEQIKIVDLAENIIRLSGFVPYEDIGIEFTGLRPGEKLYEELFDSMEEALPTDDEKLRSALPKFLPCAKDLDRVIKKLEEIVAGNRIDELIPTLQQIVPNYTSSANSMPLAGD